MLPFTPRPCRTGCNLLPSSGWVTKEDVFSYQAATLLLNGTTVTAQPLTPQSWKTGSGTFQPPNAIVNFLFDGTGESLSGQISDDCANISWSNGAVWYGGDDRCVRVCL